MLLCARLRVPAGLTPIKNLDAMISSVLRKRTDHFHNGMDISINGAGLPVKTGTVLPGPRIPLPRRAKWFLVAQHPISACCDPENQSFGSKSFTQQTQITTGNTGRSSGPHLHFSLKDDRQFLNPVEYLPKIKDTTPPILRTLVFKSGYYLRMVNGSQGQRIYLPLRNSYQILFLAQDPAGGGRRGIYRYQLKISGLDHKETVFQKEVVFDTLSQGKLSGKIALSDLFTAIWGENFIIAGEWVKKNRREDYAVELTISDFSGNTDSMKKIISFR